jgi:hypothetical protein
MTLVAQPVQRAREQPHGYCDQNDAENTDGHGAPLGGTVGPGGVPGLAEYAVQIANRLTSGCARTFAHQNAVSVLGGSK